jgi:hypothetical protein
MAFGLDRATQGPYGALETSERAMVGTASAAAKAMALIVVLNM